MVTDPFSITGGSLDPVDWQSARAQGHRMLDDILDYIENIRERPVWQPIPDSVRARFQADVPNGPTGLGGRDHMPIEVERQIVHWLRQLFEFPSTASGLFVTGTSMANLLGVLIARTRELGIEVRRNGVAAAGKNLVAYTSAAAHGCISQAMDLSGLGNAALHVIPTNGLHQIDLAALDAAIARDRNAGLTPFLVVGTAGAVDTGAIDDLAGLAAIAAREKLWFHV